MGKREGEKLHIKAIHSLAGSLYLIGCSGTWKKSNCRCAVTHPISAGRFSAAGEAEDCTSRIWSSDKVETLF